MGKGKGLQGQKHRKEKKRDRKLEMLRKLESGIAIVKEAEIFGYLIKYFSLISETGARLGKGVAAQADRERIFLNVDYELEPAQWAYVIAHCMLHHVFGHFDMDRVPGHEWELPDGTIEKKPDFHPFTWNHACDIYIAHFLQSIKFGVPIGQGGVMALEGVFEYGDMADEQSVYEYLRTHPEKNQENDFGTGFPSGTDMMELNAPVVYGKGEENEYSKLFAKAISDSLVRTVDKVSGVDASSSLPKSDAMRAASWFQAHYPLLGGLAAGFRIIEDRDYCKRSDISIAAVCPEKREIYINPLKSFSEEEWKFILAHEYLHAGLEHDRRCDGRNPYLWNIACDYVVNGWLQEMGIGSMPEEGLLYDEKLRGLSAEAIYDMLLENIRYYERLMTFRGYGKGDVVYGSGKHFGDSGDAVALDDFCRSALAQGLEYQLGKKGRGFLPAGLIEEIRALLVPPVPWDVKLAKWFEKYFPVPEKHRSYARPSRRQGVTPDIPRPRYVMQENLDDSRTFGVIVDTSGSMSEKELGVALGAIASYSEAREVPAARVVFCDAAPYDIGYVSPAEIAGRVEVRGRGGTVLQPAVTLLEAAEDFPKDGPILIITDGWIESKLVVHHTHAYLIPFGSRLPFRAKGEVFRYQVPGKGGSKEGRS